MDSNYSSEIKNWLSHQEGYSKIIYAPIEHFLLKYPKESVLGINTAFMYAENYWIVRAENNFEFKNDFFNICREDIEHFSDLLGSTNFSIIGNKVLETANQPRQESSVETTSRYVEIKNPEFTFPFGIIPIDLIYELNGYDEIYDLGHGGEQEDFISRALRIGHKFYFDNEMIGYSYKRESGTMGIHISQFIYSILLPQIQSGKTRAFNIYDIRMAQSLYLAKKEKLTVK